MGEQARVGEDAPTVALFDEREELMAGAGTRNARFLLAGSPDHGDREPFFPFSFFPLPGSATANAAFKGWPNLSPPWKRWVQKLLPLHGEAWRKAGVFHAVLASTYRYRRCPETVLGVARYFCEDTNTFIFPWGEASVSLEDVAVLGGFSSTGRPAVLASSDELASLEKQLRDARSALTRTAAKKAHLSAWMKEFDGGDCGDFEHAAFFAYWLCRFVLPGHPDCTMRAEVFPLAVWLARGERIALAPAVLAAVYRDLRLLRRCMLNRSEPDGEAVVMWAPLHIVQMWAWERFPGLCPSKTNAVVAGDGKPRAACWDNVFQKKEGLSVLRVLEESCSDFVWQPYTANRFDEDGHLSAPQWLRTCELVGIDCIEQYQPHRFARQFGMDQDVPKYVARANTNREAAWASYNLPGKTYVIPAPHPHPAVTMRYGDWWAQCMSNYGCCAGFAMKGATLLKSFVKGISQIEMHSVMRVAQNIEVEKQKKQMTTSAAIETIEMKRQENQNDNMECSENIQRQVYCDTAGITQGEFKSSSKVRKQLTKKTALEEECKLQGRTKKQQKTRGSSAGITRVKEDQVTQLAADTSVSAAPNGGNDVSVAINGGNEVLSSVLGTKRALEMTAAAVDYEMQKQYWEKRQRPKVLPTDKIIVEEEQCMSTSGTITDPIEGTEVTSTLDEMTSKEENKGKKKKMAGEKIPTASIKKRVMEGLYCNEVKFSSIFLEDAGTSLEGLPLELIGNLKNDAILNKEYYSGKGDASEFCGTIKKMKLMTDSSASENAQVVLLKMKECDDVLDLRDPVEDMVATAVCNTTVFTKAGREEVLLEYNNGDENTCGSSLDKDSEELHVLQQVDVPEGTHLFGQNVMKETPEGVNNLRDEDKTMSFDSQELFMREMITVEECIDGEANMSNFEIRNVKCNIPYSLACDTHQSHATESSGEDKVYLAASEEVNVKVSENLLHVGRIGAEQVSAKNSIEDTMVQNAVIHKSIETLIGIKKTEKGYEPEISKESNKDEFVIDGAIAEFSSEVRVGEISANLTLGVINDVPGKIDKRNEQNIVLSDAKDNIVEDVNVVRPKVSDDNPLLDCCSGNTDEAGVSGKTDNLGERRTAASDSLSEVSNCRSSCCLTVLETVEAVLCEKVGKIEDSEKYEVCEESEVCEENECTAVTVTVEYDRPVESVKAAFTSMKIDQADVLTNPSEEMEEVKLLEEAYVDAMVQNDMKELARTSNRELGIKFVDEGNDAETSNQSSEMDILEQELIHVVGQSVSEHVPISSSTVTHIAVMLVEKRHEKESAVVSEASECAGFMMPPPGSNKYETKNADEHSDMVEKEEGREVDNSEENESAVKQTASIYLRTNDGEVSDYLNLAKPKETFVCQKIDKIRKHEIVASVGIEKIEEQGIADNSETMAVGTLELNVQGVLMEISANLHCVKTDTSVICGLGKKKEGEQENDVNSNVTVIDGEAQCNPTMNFSGSSQSMVAGREFDDNTVKISVLEGVGSHEVQRVMESQVGQMANKEYHMAEGTRTPFVVKNALTDVQEQPELLDIISDSAISGTANLTNLGGENKLGRHCNAVFDDMPNGASQNHLGSQAAEPSEVMPRNKSMRHSNSRRSKSTRSWSNKGRSTAVNVKVKCPVQSMEDLRASRTEEEAQLQMEIGALKFEIKETEAVVMHLDLIAEMDLL